MSDAAIEAIADAVVVVVTCFLMLGTAWWYCRHG
jgi:hypothetical protein